MLITNKTGCRLQEITVLIPNINRIQEKNLYQLNGLQKYGYRFIIMTTDSIGRSREVIGSADHIRLFIAPIHWRRIWFIITMIRILLTTQVDIVEIYPQSLLQLVLTAIARMALKPVVIVARGLELQYVTKKMPAFQRLTVRLTYALSTFVVYKEPYMKDMLDQMGIRNIVMLNNSVDLTVPIHPHKYGQCRFLFLNSMKVFRHPEIAIQAFLQICQEYNLTAQSNIRLDVVGLRGPEGPGEVAKKESLLHSLIDGKDVPIRLYPWDNTPGQWLDNADVFLLPAEVVFLNYSLLEAMARGIPCIVQATPGSELIITHGTDGYILPPEPKIWRDHMVKLMQEASLRTRLGQAAREKIATDFSLSEYLEKYHGIYQKVIEVKVKQNATRKNRE